LQICLNIHNKNGITFEQFQPVNALNCITLFLVFTRFWKTIMNAILKALIYASISFSILVSTTHHSYAAGGGGGSSFPSASVPSFDPVEKYQEGLAHLKAKQYKKAQKAFRKVLSVAKRDANSHFYLGVAYYEGDKAKKAKKPLERAIRYNKNNVLAMGYLGAVHTILGKNDKANEQKNKLLSLKAACDNCAKQNDINTSLKLIENAQNNEQNNDQANFAPSIKGLSNGDNAYISAVELINQGQYKNALESLEKSAYSFGPHPDILTYQGFANRKLGNHDLALNYYQQALAVDDSHRGANEYLGEFFVEKGDLASANKQLEKLEKICDFGCEEAEELRRWIVASNK